MDGQFPGWNRVEASLTTTQELQGIKRQVVPASDIMERRRRYLQRWTSLKTERSRQWSKWQDLSDYILPELGRFLTSDHNQPKDTSKILNSAPTRMARSLAAGLLAGHTSPARPWLNLTVPDPQLADWKPMKAALYELNRRVRMILEFSGFYRAMAMGVYPGLATYGLGTCIAEEDQKRIMRFIPLAMGTYALACDGHGEVDTLQYEEAWTVAELTKEFEWSKLSNSVRVAYNSGWYEQYVAVLRTIEPNSEFHPGAIGARGGKWGSAWMEIGGLASAAGALSQPSSDPTIGFLREGKYDSFPVLAARWATTSRDTYPTGPGHDALPDIKQVMQLERRKLLAISKGVNPAMAIPDVLRLNRLSMLPGDAVYYPTGTQGVEIKPIHVVDVRWVEQCRSEIQACLQGIGGAFFTDLMRLFTNENPNGGKQPETAEEINAKSQEKMLMLGPVLENINEFLTRLVERTISIMAKRRLLPEFPKEARDMRLKVEFISPLAQAHKLAGAQVKERFVQFVGQVAQLKGQDALDKMNADIMIDRYAEDLGLPPDTLTDDEEVQAVRQKRAQQAEAQQQAQTLLSAADAAKSLGGVPMDKDNLVTRMLGGPAGAQAGEQGGA